MATYKEELNTNYNFENIDIFNVVNEETGALMNYNAKPSEGYVIYYVNANDTEFIENHETGDIEEIPVTYYRLLIGLPKTYNFKNFHWAAVLRSSIDEKYIFE